MTLSSNSGEARQSHPPTPSTLTGQQLIAAAFEATASEGRAALMPYMMAGYPYPEASFAVAATYVDSGADLIELGVPFSDPLADGPTIHAAATAALEAGATFSTALEICRSVADRVPVVLMVYANMVLAHGGPAEFARLATAAGAAGAIVPDLPLGESDEICQEFDAAGLALVPLVAPTTPSERRSQICDAAQGFIYVVSSVGTTGERLDVPVDLADLVAATKAESEVPIAVGFGISTPEQAAEVGQIADGVIIGSRLVRAAGEYSPPGEGRSIEAATRPVADFLSETRVALAR